MVTTPDELDEHGSVAPPELLEGLSEPALITTLSGRPIAANGPFRGMLNDLDGDVDGPPPRLEALADGQLHRIAFHGLKAARRGEAFSTTVSVETGGRAMDVRVASSPIRAREEVLWRFERRIMAREPSESETTFEPGADGFPTTIAAARFVGDLDGEARLVHANEAFLERVAAAAPHSQFGELFALGEENVLESAQRAPASIATRAAPDRPLECVLIGVEDDAFAIALFDPPAERRLDEDLEQGRKLQALGRMAGGVAHDFNNLLQAIMGFSDLLLARHPAGDPSNADLSQIKQNAVRASALVRQLLVFSRRQEPLRKVQALGDLLVELGDLLRRLIGTDIDLAVVHGRDVPKARFDESQLEMVVVNLAVNARDAMPEGGALRIRTERIASPPNAPGENGKLPPGEYAMIAVRDSGVGMSAEVRERIFEPFFTTKAVGKGTGLGLSTVYGVVTQSEGHIFCDSAPGEGTEFRIYLPAAVEEIEEVESPERRRRAADLTGRGVVLLVEDEDAVRAFGERALTSRGYEVVCAFDGQEALRRIVSGLKPDVVVSDVMMPNMDGPAFLRAARGHLPDTPFLFVSGYGAEEVRDALGQDRLVRFLPKPFSLKDLARAVKDAMNAA